MADRYPFLMRIIHWLMALAIFGMIGLGWYMVDLPKEDPSRNGIYGLHKSIGAALLCLVVLRLFIRGMKGVPALPSSMSLLVRLAAKGGHALLYLFMVITPLSGYLLSNSFGYPVNMFSIKMPTLLEKNEALGKLFREAHEILPYAFLAFLAVHVGAVIWHRYFDKPENDILGRML